MHLSQYQNLPNVDGEGFLFAFSGMDGQTNSASGFVLTRHCTGYDFLVHTPYRHQLQVSGLGQGLPEVITGDVFLVSFTEGELVMTFSAWHTVVGKLPAKEKISLLNERFNQIDNQSVCSGDDSFLVLEQIGTRFALSFGQTLEEAQLRAKAGLTADLQATLNARLADYALLPQNRFLWKCFSVMKVNSLSAEGEFQQAWSTPDRVPHRDMWLWDSVFHSLAMNKVNAPLAWDYLKSVLEQPQADGMISHQFRVDGWRSSITQPPILAWGVWENYLVNPDRGNLRYAADRLAAYLRWDEENRDQNGNGLLEWFIEENENCRSGESGLDNSQRFDEALLLDAVDFSTFAALDMSYLAKIYAELGDEENADLWQRKSTALSEKIHQLLWSEAQGFYLDRKLNGVFSPVEAVTGFLPLLLDDFPVERLTTLVSALEDSSRFDTPMPIPSVSLQTPDWSTDMWRGAAWINMNYLVILGLTKQGEKQLADKIREKTLEVVKKYYQQSGVIYEFYDALDQHPPEACDRKGPRQEPYDIRRKMDSIRDYHWSAALSFLMLLEK